MDRLGHHSLIDPAISLDQTGKNLRLRELPLSAISPPDIALPHADRAQPGMSSMSEVAIASRLEAIASRLEAIASRLEC